MAPPTPLPPPSPPRAWLAMNVLWLTVRRLALLTMPPPLAAPPPLLPLAWLWLNRLLLTVRVAPATLTMAPPWAVPPGSLTTWLFASMSLARVRLPAAVKMAPAAPPGAPAVVDRQAGDEDRPPAADGKDPAGVVAADGQLGGPRALDVDALADCQRTTGQRDGLAFEAGVED